MQKSEYFNALMQSNVGGVFETQNVIEGISTIPIYVAGFPANPTLRQNAYISVESDTNVANTRSPYRVWQGKMPLTFDDEINPAFNNFPMSGIIGIRNDRDVPVQYQGFIYRFPMIWYGDGVSFPQGKRMIDMRTSRPHYTTELLYNENLKARFEFQGFVGTAGNLTIDRYAPTAIFQPTQIVPPGTILGPGEYLTCGFTISGDLINDSSTNFGSNAISSGCILNPFSTTSTLNIDYMQPVANVVEGDIQYGNLSQMSVYFREITPGRDIKDPGIYFNI